MYLIDHCGTYLMWCRPDGGSTSDGSLQLRLMACGLYVVDDMHMSGVLTFV